MRAISLMYHDVIQDSSPQDGIARRITAYSLTYKHFCAHLDSIPRNAAVRTIEARRQWSQETPIFLTFDDGELSAYNCSAEALEVRNWRGHFFITTDWIARPGFMNAAQIRQLRARGHVIGSHSCSHPERMSQLSKAQLEDEWSKSCTILADILGERIRVASVPAGYYSRTVGKAAAAAGIEVLFTSEPTIATALENGCLILGRYAIQGHMLAEVSGKISAGLVWPRLRQNASWQAKKLLKAIAGESYFTLRSALLARLGRQTATKLDRPGSSAPTSKS